MVLTGDAEQALETVRAYCRLHPRDPHGLRYDILFRKLFNLFNLYLGFVAAESFLSILMQTNK
jgi:hypothetical protein